MSQDKKTTVDWLVNEFSEILGPLPMNGMQVLLMLDARDKAIMKEKEEYEYFSKHIIEEVLNRLDIGEEINFKNIFEVCYNKIYTKKQ